MYRWRKCKQKQSRNEKLKPSWTAEQALRLIYSSHSDTYTHPSGGLMIYCPLHSAVQKRPCPDRDTVIIWINTQAQKGIQNQQSLSNQFYRFIIIKEKISSRLAFSQKHHHARNSIHSNLLIMCLRCVLGRRSVITGASHQGTYQCCCGNAGQPKGYWFSMRNWSILSKWEYWNCIIYKGSPHICSSHITSKYVVLIQSNKALCLYKMQKQCLAATFILIGVCR